MAVQNTSAAVDFNTIATQTLVTGVAGKRIVVYGYLIDNGVATAQSIQFKSGSNNLTGVMQLPQQIGGVINDASGSDSTALFVTDVGATLGLAMTAATQVGGYVSYKFS